MKQKPPRFPRGGFFNIAEIIDLGLGKGPWM
jgi:hypothetical protein